ncbi:MAG: hypothetical protein ACRDHE_02235, partial [Ktedonobacterales bacterium]
MWIAIVFNVFRAQVFVVSLPVLHLANMARGLVPLDFFLAILAGVGLDTIHRSGITTRANHWVALALAGLMGAIVVAIVYYTRHNRTLTHAQGTLRVHSLIAPLALSAAVVVALLAVCLLPPIARSMGARLAGHGFWIAQCVFLLTAGMGINSYSHTFFPVNNSIAQLQKTVGTNLVGSLNGVPTTWSVLGFMPETNSADGVHEFAAYDPLLPSVYTKSWTAVTGQQVPDTYVFSPSIDSATIAQLYG